MSLFEDSLPQSATELINKSKTDIQRELEKVSNENQANAFLDGGWLSASAVAGGNRAFDYNLQLVEAKRQNFPDTAEGENADQWGSIIVGNKNAAVGASGLIVITGTAGTTVTTASNYQSSDGIIYSVITGGSISVQVLSVDSLTSIGTLATLKTSSPHQLSSAVEVVVSGAVEPEYNGTFDIQVTSDDEFTYQLPSSTTSPATGTITVTFTSGFVEVQADVPTDEDAPFGSATNLNLDAPLTIETPIAGLDNVAKVTFGGVQGGFDEESEEDYKARYLSRLRNPVAHFNEADIDRKVKDDVEGVARIFQKRAGAQLGQFSITSIDRFDLFAKVVSTAPHGLFNGARVTITGAGEPEYNVVEEPVLVLDDSTFVYKVLGSPSTPATGTITSTGVVPLGHVQIYFTRDDDEDPIPTAPEIADVLESVVEISPVNTPEDFVLVNAPIANPINFVFSEINPTTLTMRTAIENNLSQFFEERVSVGGGIDEDAYRAAIFNTIDPDTGDVITTFDLSSPSGDILGESGKLPTLGTVTFP